MSITIPPNTSAFVPVECQGKSGTDLVVFEPDPAYIEKYKAYPCPGLLGVNKPAAVRILNANPDTLLTIAMGTVFGKASPVESVNSVNYMREVVPVDPPLTVGPHGFEGDPVDRWDMTVEQLLVEN